MKKKILHAMNEMLEFMELVLSGMILLVLFGTVILSIWRLATNPEMFLEANFLHNFLGNFTTLVVTVEFVKMLLHPTAGNTLELLIMTISRYVVLNHHDYIAIAVGIGSIVALFATRRFLTGMFPCSKGSSCDDLNTEHQ